MKINGNYSSYESEKGQSNPDRNRKKKIHKRRQAGELDIGGTVEFLQNQNLFFETANEIDKYLL